MNKSKYIHKAHNVSVLMYHLVFPAKYRKAVLSDNVNNIIKDACLEIEKRYEIIFLEIGTDLDHVHLLVQTVPSYSVTKLVTIIKSITAKQVFAQCPEVKKQLWGGEFWSSGYFVSTVGQHGNETMISKYVKNQGKEKYNKLHTKKYQPNLFEDL
jgi:REP element-mobilizing transposase RayT